MDVSASVHSSHSLSDIPKYIPSLITCQGAPRPLRLALRRLICYTTPIRMIGLGTKFLIKVLLNGLGLYIAQAYLSGFTLQGGIKSILISAVLIALLWSLLRPILRLLATPLVWVTLGLFNIVINMALLWVADLLLPELSINGISTLLLLSIILSTANIF